MKSQNSTLYSRKAQKKIRTAIYLEVARVNMYRGIFKRRYGKEHVWENVDCIKHVLLKTKEVEKIFREIILLSPEED
jgi:hypothetical protein